MPRKGRLYFTVYPSDEQYLRIKERAEEANKSVSQYFLDQAEYDITEVEDEYS